jgi:hypothetical protein
MDSLINVTGTEKKKGIEFFRKINLLLTFNSKEFKIDFPS